MKSSTYSLSKDDCRPEEGNDGEGAVDDGPRLELNQGRLVISSTGCFSFFFMLWFIYKEMHIYLIWRLLFIISTKIEQILILISVVVKTVT